MVKSIFTGKIMESKWVFAYTTSFGDESKWHIHPRYIGVCYSLGHTLFHGREHIRILERREIDYRELDFELYIGDSYNLGDKIVRIESKIFNSNNTITYHTDYEIENTVIESKEEAEKKRDEWFEKQRKNNKTEEKKSKTTRIKELVSKFKTR